MMRIRIDWKNKPNPLVIVSFEEGSNFSPNDLSWVPTREELSRIHRAMKKAGAYR